MQLFVFELIAAILLGLASGIMPGLHPNSIGAVLGEFMSSQEYWPLFLMAMLGARMALQFIPSIFLGVPDGETQISLLPGQRMLLEGEAKTAILICAFSVLAASALAMLLSPILMPILPSMFALVKPYSGYLLILAALVLLGSEIEYANIAKAIAVFLLAGALGAIALDAPMPDPLFAMFAGFFTIPALVGQGEQLKKMPKQKKAKKIGLGILPYILVGVALGGLADLLPGISTPAQIAIFASLLIAIDAPASFLALVASIEASHAVFAITSSAAAGIARVGVVAMAQDASPITPAMLPMMFGAYSLALGIGAIATLWAGEKIAKHWAAVDWSLLSKIIGAYIVVMIFAINGIMGIVVLICASAIGMLPIFWGIRRTHVMGSLIAPSIMRGVFAA